MPHSRTRRSVLAAGVLALALLGTGCAGRYTGAVTASGAQVTDEMIEARLATLPGVQKVTFKFNETLSRVSYDGVVTIAPGTDPLTTLDAAGRIVWHAGRPGYSAGGVAVSCPSGCQDTWYTILDLGLTNGEDKADWCERRWGPRNGILD